MGQVNGNAAPCRSATPAAVDDRGALWHALFEPKTTSASAGAVERTPAYHATSSNERTAADAIARPYQFTMPHQLATTQIRLKIGVRARFVIVGFLARC